MRTALHHTYLLGGRGSSMPAEGRTVGTTRGHLPGITRHQGTWERKVHVHLMASRGNI